MKKALCIAIIAALSSGGAAWAEGPANPLQPGESWASLQGDVVGDAAPQTDESRFRIDAPHRAEDPALVAVSLHQDAGGAPLPEEVILVVDENPAPVAASFRFGPDMAPLEFETRVRVNQYSNVRAVAMSGGEALMSGRFVKASGGCSAPASKNPAVALSTMGQMKLRMYGEAAQSGVRREAQVMIRHPNYSGLQRDQVTNLFVPAHFIDHVEVYQGETLLFSVDGGISLSENPTFRFRYHDDGSESFRILATDTEGNRFEEVIPKAAAS